MPADFPALAALRQATYSIHQDLEQVLRIASPNASRDDYLAYIGALWGWMSGFEQELWHGAWPPALQAERRAQKCAWLLCDLRDAGLSDAAIRQLPRSGFRPDMDGLPARFGTAYVIEGAQLGTQVLHKRLAPLLTPWSPRWLAGYGQETGAYWRAFIACAEHSLVSEKDRATAAQAASQTFSALAAWFEMQNACFAPVGAVCPR